MTEAVSDYPDRVWAVEGANGMGRAVAQRLVATGGSVIDVPAKLSTRVRVYSTGHGSKTDKTDAVATARAALQLVATRVQAVGRLHLLTPFGSTANQCVDQMT